MNIQRFPQRRRALASLVLFVLTTFASAQEAQDSPQSATLTFHTQSRLVIEDVLVTDTSGNAVHGLPASAFQVTDNGKPQSISSFEEADNSVADAPSVPLLPPGTFSNSSYATSPKIVSQVFLVDADDLEPTTQLFLLGQLKQAITQMPQGMQGSVFCVRAGRPVQVRGMTVNRDELNRGLGECIPSVEHAGVNAFASGVNQILTVASFLQPIPGRKNVLWFAGPFPLVPITSQEQQAGGISVNPQDRNQLIHQLQETLAESRVAIYPIDPRGVLTNGLANPGAPVNQTANRSMGVASSVDGAESVPVPTGASDMDRIDYMQELAQATGGRAYILNDLKAEIMKAFDLSKSSYTVSYAPHDYANDESWHAVTVKVDGPYKLSYRRGYLAMWNGDVSSVAAQVLESTGQHHVLAKSVDASKPLLFDVKVDQAAPSTGDKRARQIALLFSVAPDQLGFVSDEGHWKNEFLIASYAYDEHGNLKGGEQQEVDASFTAEQWATAQSRAITTHQSFAVPKNAKYVLFVIRDKRSRKQGTLMLTTRALSAAQ